MFGFGNIVADVIDVATKPVKKLVDDVPIINSIVNSTIDDATTASRALDKFAKGQSITSDDVKALVSTGLTIATIASTYGVSELQVSNMIK